MTRRLHPHAHARLLYPVLFATSWTYSHARGFGHWWAVHLRRHIPFAVYTAITVALMAWMVFRLAPLA